MTWLPRSIARSRSVHVAIKLHSFRADKRHEEWLEFVRPAHPTFDRDASKLVGQY
jgi:hypothetical protein